MPPACRRHLLLFGLLLIAGTIATVPGCRCRQETPQERAAREQLEEEERLKRLKEKKEKLSKPPIETKPLTPQPSQPDQPLPVVKPGHWMNATQVTKANYEDWIGSAHQQITDREGQPTPIERTAFTLRTSRPAAVAKGQEKALETILFLPNSYDSTQLRTSLLDRSGGYPELPSLTGLTRLLPHQYHFVVLAAEPERYGFLRNGSYSVDAPIAWNIDVAGPRAGTLPPQRNYRVVAPPVDKPIILSDNPLCWTTTAYVLWDEVDPQRFTPAQQGAMIDWLHWGGQLIVSGPDSLDLLGESFLEPYLPADGGGPRTITAEDIEPLVGAYGVSEKGRPPLAEDAAWSGVWLEPRPSAETARGAKGLFAERRVGRGRVIVSGVQLAERGLLSWAGGFENLLNALILRRPPRRFANSNVSFDTGETPLYVRQRDRDSPLLDAAVNTRVRFFARDTHTNPDALRYRTATPNDRQGRFGGLIGDEVAGSGKALVPGGEAGGAAAWSDFNAAANAAREALREAAGVKVPGRGFVLGCLAVYLAVIGPINWVFFKALGRVELAWVAAPVITAVGAATVVRQAELDIGFARAQTEIAILETQPDYPRGHLTRYTAIYTSLSTTYDFASDEQTTLIAPFPRASRDEDWQLLRGQTLTDVTFERQDKVRLRGFAVSSAATDMAHSEQMVSLPKGLRYLDDKRRLVNNTGMDLSSLAVVRREATRDDDPPSLVGCWIGLLPADQSTTVTFAPIPFSADSPAFVQQRQAEAEQAGGERLNLEPLFRLALDAQQIAPGEVRAVARVDKTLPGLEVTPRAAQVTGATLVVAHLEYPPLPPPKNDANAPIDVASR